MAKAGTCFDYLTLFSPKTGSTKKRGALQLRTAPLVPTRQAAPTGPEPRTGCSVPQNLGRYQPQPRFPGKPWHRRRCLGREAGLFLEPLKTAEEKGDRKPCVRARSSPSGTFCCKTPPGAAGSAGLIPCLGLGQQQGGAPGPAAVPSHPKLSQGTSPAHGGHNNGAAQWGLNGATCVPM